MKRECYMPDLDKEPKKLQDLICLILVRGTALPSNVAVTYYSLLVDYSSLCAM